MPALTNGLKALFFDLDETLHARTIGLRSFARAQADDFDWPQRTKERFVERFIEEDNKGLTAKRLVYETLAVEFSISLDPSLAEADYVTKFLEYALELPHATEAILHAKNANLLTGVITNGPARLQNAVIKSLGLDRYLDTIVVSESVGVSKPDKEIFHHALRSVSVSANEALHVGDSFSSDVLGARHAGLRAVHFETNPIEKIDEAPAVASMLELVELLQFDR